MNNGLPQKPDLSIMKSVREQLQSAPALKTLANLSFSQLDEDYTPKTPHEAMAVELVKQALYSPNANQKMAAQKIYWDLQKQILQMINKSTPSGAQVNIKADNALAIALDNIGAKVLDGKVVE